MHFLTVLPFFLATILAAAAGDRVSTPAAASVPKVCTIKASGGVAPCRYCPKTTCGVKMYVYNSAEFVCWKAGDLENSIV